MNTYEPLCTLLKNLAGDAEDLRILLHMTGLEDAALDELPSAPASLDETADAAYRVLREYGHLTPDWFEQLTAQRPRQQVLIARVAALFTAQPKPVFPDLFPDPAPVPAPVLDPNAARPWTGENGRLPLVLVPGLGGSNLRDGDRRVWPPGAVTDLVGIAPLVNAPLTPDGVVRDVQGMAWLDPEEVGTYGPLIDDVLVGRLGYRVGVDLLLIDYDWRGDPRVSAQRLGDAIDTFVASLSSKSGGAPVRLVILAHSLGGTVTRWYVDHLGGAARTAHLILLAPVDRGTASGATAVLRGRVNADGPGPLKPGFFESILLSSLGGLPTLRSVPVVSALVPIEPCVVEDNGSPVDIRTDRSWLVPVEQPTIAWLAAGSAMFQAIRSPSTVPATYVYGTGGQAVVRIVVARSTETGQLQWDDATIETGVGDGVIAAVQARPGDAARGIDTLWIDARHSSMFNHADIGQIVSDRVAPGLSLQDALAAADVPASAIAAHLDALLAGTRYKEAEDAILGPMLRLEPVLVGRPPEDLAAILLGARPELPISVHGVDPAAGPACPLWARRCAGLDPRTSLPLPVYIDSEAATLTDGALRGLPSLGDAAERLLLGVPTLLVVTDVGRWTANGDPAFADAVAALQHRWPKASLLLLDPQDIWKGGLPTEACYRVLCYSGAPGTEAFCWFDRPIIGRMFKAAVDAGLNAAGMQDILRADMPPELAGALPRLPDADVRLYETLLMLNRVPAGPDGVAPLAVWLKAALVYCDWMPGSPLHWAAGELARRTGGASQAEPAPITPPPTSP